MNTVDSFNVRNPFPVNVVTQRVSPSPFKRHTQRNKSTKLTVKPVVWNRTSLPSAPKNTTQEIMSQYNTSLPSDFQMMVDDLHIFSYGTFATSC